MQCVHIHRSNYLATLTYFEIRMKYDTVSCIEVCRCMCSVMRLDWINLPIYIRSASLCFLFNLMLTMKLHGFAIHLFSDLIQFSLVRKLIKHLYMQTECCIKYVIQVENTVI